MEDTLFKHFGFRSFRDGQKEIVESIMAGKDTVAMLPTGSGKSLCYQFPSYLTQSQVLIVSPLLSLMQDQVEQIKFRGEKKVIALNSFLAFKERKRALKNLRYYRFIFISPEMLNLPEMKEALSSCRINLFVVDEAHCISQWGPDFRPDYLTLGKIKEDLGNPVTLALTATATVKIRADICQILNMDNPNEWIYSVNRPNIALRVDQLSTFKEKVLKLKGYIESLASPGIVYFSSKKLADELASEMNQTTSKKISSYHAGLEQDQRILIQQQFITDQLDWIFATSAFGMGVNKENIRTVIHFHLPSSMEAFVQEIGRAGRDGNKSLSILLYLSKDEQITTNLLELERPSIRQISEFEKMYNTSSDLKKIEEQIGLSEVQNRVLHYYAKKDSLKKNWVNHVDQQISTRILEKKSKMIQMTEYVTADVCRRQKITQCFDEDQPVPQLLCCDHCGFALDPFKDNQESLNTHLTWQERLSTIFKESENVRSTKNT
ncbi:ATP-dependent DNA helicase [Jeotgalibacillus sp. ET6]|uniref:RecQ family ATP-dependent DNA helicase n=1 Tax=Jeotgalibacillus sp. ET6 TaxID=3037260 RepID=UPI00241821F4|nr:ATP-dependent DNA helicase RecQ [Jeotgalibacillus sp. ET6]MDG5470674.1 ATP-dependent DNA helicase [Jeotgalibacillus sp. ET6]